MALHGLEPREQVLEDPRLHVVGAGLAVRRGRALVEDPGLAVGGLLQAAREHPVALPAREHVALERGQVDLGGKLTHGWGSFSVGTARRRDEEHAPRGTTLLGPGAAGSRSGRAAPLRG